MTTYRARGVPPQRGPGAGERDPAGLPQPVDARARASQRARPSVRALSSEHRRRRRAGPALKPLSRGLGRGVVTARSGVPGLRSRAEWRPLGSPLEPPCGAPEAAYPQGENAGIRWGRRSLGLHRDVRCLEREAREPGTTRERRSSSPPASRFRREPRGDDYGLDRRYAAADTAAPEPARGTPPAVRGTTRGRNGAPLAPLVPPMAPPELA
jgi:hypothetical protein